MDTIVLSEGCRREVVEHLRVAAVGEDAAFPNQFGQGRSLILMISGIARVFIRTHDGKDVTQYFVRAEDFVLPNLNEQRGELEHVEAITEVQFVHMPFATFERLLMRYPELTAVYASLLNKQGLRDRERSERQARSEAVETYASFLQAHPGLETQVPTAHLASYLGLSTSQFMRARQKYRDRAIM